MKPYYHLIDLDKQRRMTPLQEGTPPRIGETFVLHHAGRPRAACYVEYKVQEVIHVSNLPMVLVLCTPTSRNAQRATTRLHDLLSFLNTSL